MKAFKLSAKDLLPHVLSTEDMKIWGFMTEIPDRPGSTNPSEEGRIKECERCNKPFVVKRKEEADECIFHWGRALMQKVGGNVDVLRACLKLMMTSR